MKFILCADLHLKIEEKEYSFAVLEEILELCKRENCEALLLAGDVFDSWNDAENLRAGFSTALEALPSSCAVYFLPGNHEELRAAGNLENLSFGKAKLLAQKPCQLYQDFSAEAELLAVPFQSDYSSYRDWGVPPKKKPVRILLAHGTAQGIVYTGNSEEEADGVLDEDLFAHFKIDFAALGHIHRRLGETRENTIIAYPGSSRVWRAGETGKHCVLMGRTETMPSPLEPLVLASAGEYHVIPVYAAPGGELNLHLPDGLSDKDWLHLELAGVVEDEPSIMAAFEKCKTELKKKYRIVSTSTEKLSVLAGVSTHPLAVRFLKAWEASAANYKGEENGVYELARLQGLVKLKEILG